MPARCAPARWALPARRACRSRPRSCTASGRSRPRWRDRSSRQIARLAEPAALDRLADAAGRLHEARRIYCLGLRSCHAAAWHFHYMLSLLGDKTVMLDDAGGTGLDAHPRRRRGGRPAGRQRRALCPRHHRGGALRRRRGVPVVALTDSEVSPLAQIAAARSWWRPTARPSSTRMTPLLAVAEILAALVAGRGGAEGAGRPEPHRGAARRLRRPPAAPTASPGAHS